MENKSTKFSQAKRLFNSVKNGLKNIKNTEVVICPPFVYLPVLKIESKSPSFTISFGGQSCFWEEKGAFTGEVSPTMLKDLGCDYVILGHSERRKYLKETDEMINKKIKAVLSLGLKPILCIANLTQLKKSLRGIEDKVIIAYEPVFAIGTGKPCTIEKAKKMRNLIKYPVVLYGGSVNSQNATDYIKMAGFQGLLVGGASLDSEEFIKLAKNVAHSR